MVIERVVDTLLTELDGLQSAKNIIVLAATNRPDRIDPALLRPGRFDKIIEIPIPGEDTRLSILKVHTRRMPLEKDVSLKELAKSTEGYTGAEIENICREAGMEAMRKELKEESVKERDWEKVEVTKRDFAAALEEVRPSIPRELAERITRFREEPENMYR